MSGTGVEKFGDHALVASLLRTLPADLEEVVEIALKQEGLWAVSRIKEGIVAQAPGGQAFTPLKPSTLALRQQQGFSGTKALIVHGDLLNSVVSIYSKGVVFVGIARTARGKDGKELINVAAIHEFGAGPKFVAWASERQRRFVMALMEKAGMLGNPTTARAGGGGYLLFIPARPYIRPTFKKFYGNEREASERFVGRIKKLLPATKGSKSADTDEGGTP